MINPHDVVTVSTMSGEFVGRMVTQDGSSVTIKSPRMFIQQGDGSGGFLPVIAMTGKRDLDEVTLYNVTFVIETDPEAEKAWVQATSSIQIV